MRLRSAGRGARDAVAAAVFEPGQVIHGLPPLHEHHVGRVLLCVSVGCWKCELIGLHLRHLDHDAPGVALTVAASTIGDGETYVRHNRLPSDTTVVTLDNLVPGGWPAQGGLPLVTICDRADTVVDARSAASRRAMRAELNRLFADRGTS